MRHLPHPDAVSRHAAVRADGSGGPAAAQELVAIRHGPRRVPARRDDARSNWPKAMPGATRACFRIARSGAGGPTILRAVLPYLAMSYLYKRSNRFWHFLIRRRLTATAWRPLVEWTRRRHIRFRRHLAASTSTARAFGNGHFAKCVKAGQVLSHSAEAWPSMSWPDPRVTYAAAGSRPNRLAGLQPGSHGWTAQSRAEPVRFNGRVRLTLPSRDDRSGEARSA